MLPGMIPLLAGVAGPVDLDYRTDAFAAASADTAMTFPGVDIGTPGADRYVYVAFTAEANGVVISSMTIGGVSATKVNSITNVGATPDLRAEIWYALVPTGSTATIVANFTTAVTGDMVASTWRVTGVSLPVADAATNQASGTSVAATVDVPPAGAVIAVACKGGDDASTAWTGAIENTDVDAGAYAHTAASAEVPAGEAGRTVTATAAANNWALAAVAIG